MIGKPILLEVWNILLTRTACKWGYSSAGRAPALHAGGLRFDPA